VTLKKIGVSDKSYFYVDASTLADSTVYFSANTEQDMQKVLEATKSLKPRMGQGFMSLTFNDCRELVTLIRGKK
jgi:hypothetical protein